MRQGRLLHGRGFQVARPRRLFSPRRRARPGATTRLHQRQSHRSGWAGAAWRHRDHHRAEHRVQPRGGDGPDRRLLGLAPDTRHLHADGRDARVWLAQARRPRVDGGHGNGARPQDAARGRAGAGDRHGAVAAGRADEQQDWRHPVAQRDRGSAVELPELHGAHPAHSRDDAQPGRLDLRRRTGGGQRNAIAAERLPDRRHVQQRRPPGRQPGHAGARRPRQHRGIPGAVEPVQRRVRRRRRRDHQHGDARRHQQLQRPRVHATSGTTGSTRADISCRRPRRNPTSGRCRPASGSAVRSSRTGPISTSRTSGTTKTSPARSVSRLSRRRWRRT